MMQQPRLQGNFFKVSTKIILQPNDLEIVKIGVYLEFTMDSSNRNLCGETLEDFCYTDVKDTLTWGPQTSNLCLSQFTFWSRRENYKKRCI